MSGKTFVNDSVFIDVAREAMRKVEEVLVSEDKGGFSSFTRAFTERFTPHIMVTKTEADELADEPDSVSFEVKLTVVYGVKIPEVAQKVREKIITEVEAFTGYKVDKVDIIIEKIVRAEEIDENKDEQDTKEE